MRRDIIIRFVCMSTHVCCNALKDYSTGRRIWRFKQACPTRYGGKGMTINGWGGYLWMWFPFYQACTSHLVFWVIYNLSILCTMRQSMRQRKVSVEETRYSSTGWLRKFSGIHHRYVFAFIHQRNKLRYVSPHRSRWVFLSGDERLICRYGSSIIVAKPKDLSLVMNISCNEAHDQIGYRT